jgi:hypothetical protein
LPAALSEIISTADGRTIRSETRISGPAREGGRCEPFKSAGSAQKFLSAHAAVNNTFKPQLIVLHTAAMSMWREVVAAHEDPYPWQRDDAFGRDWHITAVKRAER